MTHNRLLFFWWTPKEHLIVHPLSKTVLQYLHSVQWRVQYRYVCLLQSTEGPSARREGLKNKGKCNCQGKSYFLWDLWQVQLERLMRKTLHSSACGNNWINWYLANLSPAPLHYTLASTVARFDLQSYKFSFVFMYFVIDLSENICSISSLTLTPSCIHVILLPHRYSTIRPARMVTSTHAYVLRVNFITRAYFFQNIHKRLLCTHK